ncbi:MAG: hypothetical protein MUF43_13695 [Flavobacterium sp.]|jgi:hypothetical protein|nr:hypothetical protein [Flavobacterium sp.]
MDSSYFVTTTEHLEQRLKEVSADNLEHRNIIIGAIEKLVKDYVVPAMKVCPLYEDSIYTFDIETVAGEELGSLTLGLFKSRIEELVHPGDENLKEFFSMLGVPDATLKQRESFFAGWAGDQAVDSIISLSKFLSGSEKELSKDALQSELTRISNLLELDLPKAVTSYLNVIYAYSYEPA